MKHLKFLLVLFLSCMTLQTFAANNYNQIVFFGDSLSDNGNLYYFDLNTLPLSPPYFNGRFSNGPTWAENVAKNLADNNNIKSQNFAIGGETANYFPSDSYFNTDFDLNFSLYDYYLNNPFSNKSHTLFVLWIGGNDYLKGNITNLDKLTSDTVNKIQDTVNDLISHGGKYFLVINLPDMGKSPVLRSNPMGPVFTQASILHNTKLQNAVAAIQAAHNSVNIQLFDVNALFADLTVNTATYNEKYGTQISNLTDSCWTGGFSLQATLLNEDEIARQLEKTYNAKLLSHSLKTPTAKPIDFHALAHQIATSKPLSVAYSVSQSYAQGVTPCANPDAYLFWDGVHPTKVVHQILGGELISYINQVFPQN